MSRPSDGQPLSDDEAERLLAPLLDARADPQPAPHDEARGHEGPTASAVVVLAVSGGPDSTALMGLAARLAPARLAVATVDHGLRPDSRDEAEGVARLATALGLAHHRLDWTGPKPRAGVQAAARAARYALLVDLARALGASHLATAHTRDDQAETVLMRLACGSGVAGLAAMRPVTDLGGIVLARPFLGVPRARLVATCRARGWPFVDDPTNADPRFARARLRRIRPLLAAEGLTDARLARLADRARRADDALGAAARDVLAGFRRPGPGVRLDGAGLLAAPEAVALRVVARALAEAVPGAPTPRLDRLEALVLGALLPALARGSPLRRTLAGALVALAPDGRLTLTPAPPRRAGEADAAGPPHCLGKGRSDSYIGRE